MAQPIADLQVYVGKSLEAAKQELEGLGMSISTMLLPMISLLHCSSLGYTVDAFGVAVCTFSSAPADEKLPAVDPTPSNPNKPIHITYNVDDPQQRVRSINQ